MSISDAKDFLDNAFGESHPGFKFDTPGTTIAGEIVEKPRPVEVDSLKTPGTKETKLVVPVRNDADGQTYSVWIAGYGGLIRAVKAALRTADAATLAEGGKLAIRYTGDGEVTKPGFRAPKLYSAKYEPPTGGVNVDDIFGDQPATADESF